MANNVALEVGAILRMMDEHLDIRFPNQSLILSACRDQADQASQGAGQGSNPAPSLSDQACYAEFILCQEIIQYFREDRNPDFTGIFIF